jgi:triosephosphate isomerase
MIKPPIFELGPKAYMYGKDFVELSIFADQLSEKYDVRIIVTPQYVDIPVIAKETNNIFVFAQHMDSLNVGRGIGSVLPESIKAAGASGVLLNHIEKRLTNEELTLTMNRAKEVGLMTMVCADTSEDAKRIAYLNPTLIIAESPALIGNGQRNVEEIDDIERINRFVWEISPNTLVLHGAGINDAQDVYDVISAGAQGTGSTSGIMLAEDRFNALEEMIRSVHEAWKKKNIGQEKI